MSSIHPYRHPFVICVATDHKCSNSGSTSRSSSNVMGTWVEPIQFVCPYTGSFLSNTNNFQYNCTNTTHNPNSTHNNHNIFGGGGGASFNNIGLRVGTGVGIQSMARFPTTVTSLLHTDTNVYLAYGGKNRDDRNAMLLLQGSTSPIWRCRLPEPMDGGLTISPCGRYILGASTSGRCYCWSTLHNGELLRIWSAHYRAIQTVCFSQCGLYFVTGGADGVVHVWSLLDIVSMSSSSSTSATNANTTTIEKTIHPMRTWSEHNLPINTLYAMPSNRMVSSSCDRQIIIMELFSAQTLARITMPTAIHSITTDTVGHRLYAGGSNGVIYLIDLDSYAISSTAESATVIHNRFTFQEFYPQLEDTDHLRRMNQNESIFSFSGSNLEESLFGIAPEKPYTICELQGHENAVTCLQLLEGSTMRGEGGGNGANIDDLLVSGGEDGTIRIWDLRARCCSRVIRPWSSTTSKISLTDESPCTSILVLPRVSLEQSHSDVKSMFPSSYRKEPQNRGNTLLNLIQPLQRFMLSNQPSNKGTQNDDLNYDSQVDVDFVIPMMKPMSTLWSPVLQTTYPRLATHENRIHQRKKQKVINSILDRKTSEQELVSAGIESNASVSSTNDAIKESPIVHSADIQPRESQREVERLKQELKEARETIDRWQKVNNKLVQKLKKISS